MNTNTLKTILNKDETFVALSEYSSYGVVLFLSILIKYLFGLEQLGEFNFSFSYSQFLLLGFGAGFNLLLRRDFLTNIHGKRDYFYRVLKIKILVGIFSLFFSLVIFNYFLSNHSIFYLIIFLIAKIFDSFSEYFLLLYLINSKFKFYSILKITYSLFQLLTIGIAYLCSNEFSIKLLYILLLVSSIVNFIFILFLTIKQIEIFYRSKEVSTQSNGYGYIFKEVFPILINTLVFQVASKFIIISIFFIQGAFIAGLFSIGLIVVSILSNISLSIGNVIFNKIKVAYNTGNFRVNNYREIVYVNLKYGVYAYLLGVLFFCFTYYFTNFLEKDTLVEYLIICLSIIPIFVVNVIGNMFLITNKQYGGMKVGIQVAILNILFLLSVSIFFKSFIVLAISYVLSQFFQYLIIHLSIKKLIFNSYV